MHTRPNYLALVLLNITFLLRNSRTREAAIASVYEESILFTMHLILSNNDTFLQQNINYYSNHNAMVFAIL